jgi:hypothetical protein
MTNGKLEKTYSPDFIFHSKNNYTVKRIQIRYFSLHNTTKREILVFSHFQEKNYPPMENNWRIYIFQNLMYTNSFILI